jgi:hypothetical protein
MFIPVERANKVAFSAPEAARAAVLRVYFIGVPFVSPLISLGSKPACVRQSPSSRVGSFSPINHHLRARHVGVIVGSQYQRELRDLLRRRHPL